MFYVKCKGRKVNLREDNVFTRCPECGKEHTVDLSLIFDDGKADFYSTTVYCEECTQKQLNDGQ